MNNNIYVKNGYKNREDYLNNLAEDYGLEKEEVYNIANVMGENEDFDGLISALDEFVDYLELNYEIIYGGNKLYINNIVKGESVKFIKGDFKNKTGIFKRITGYTDGYGCVCEIEIEGKNREFTSNFFKFTLPTIQAMWEDDYYDFKLE